MQIREVNELLELNFLEMGFLNRRREKRVLEMGPWVRVRGVGSGRKIHTLIVDVMQAEINSR